MTLVLAIALGAAAVAQTPMPLMPLVSGQGLAVLGAGGAPAAVVDAVRRAARDAALLPVQEAATTAAHLDEARALGIDCDPAETACAVRIGALAGVARAVVVAARGTEVELVIVDVARQVEGGSVRVTAARGAVDPAIEDAVVRLLAPERWFGLLDVRVARQGGVVKVDGAIVGDTPLRGPIPVAPGPHVVEIDVPGAPAIAREATVRRGQRAVIVVDAGGDATGAPAEVAAPAAPLSPLVAVGGAFAGGGALVAVGAVVVLVVAEVLLATPRGRDERNAFEATAQTAAGVAVTSAVVALAGGGVLIAGLVAGDE